MSIAVVAAAPNLRRRRRRMRASLSRSDLDVMRSCLSSRCRLRRERVLLHSNPFGAPCSPGRVATMERRRRDTRWRRARNPTRFPHGCLGSKQPAERARRLQVPRAHSSSNRNACNRNRCRSQTHHVLLCDTPVAQTIRSHTLTTTRTSSTRRFRLGPMLGLISDVHGNLVALDGDRRRTAPGVTAWWVLGDLAAVGPEPAATLERLANLPNARSVRATPTGTPWRVTDPSRTRRRRARCIAASLVRRGRIVVRMDARRDRTRRLACLAGRSPDRAARHAGRRHAAVGCARVTRVRRRCRHPTRAHR